MQKLKLIFDSLTRHPQDCLNIKSILFFERQCLSILQLDNLFYVFSFQVRSHRHTDLGNKASLGFMVDPKRFNVAVTRAEALLIIVGDPYVLQQVYMI